MRLFLDDRRRPRRAEETLATSVRAARELLLAAETVEAVSLDYDLGPAEETGLSLLIWMDEVGIRPPYINVHSTHFWGREALLEYARAHFPHSIVTDHPAD